MPEKCSAKKFDLPKLTAFFLVLSLTSIIAAFAKNDSIAGRAAGARRSVESGAVPAQPLPNFHEVHPFLYRGGEPNFAGVEKLKLIGIKTVIDLRAPTVKSKAEKAHVEALGLKYICLPMSDKAPTASQVATFIDTTRTARKSSEPVFVHCAHGSDRTGCMVGIWRVTEDGYTYSQAYKEMRQYYFGPQFTQLSTAVKSRALK